MGGIGIWQIFIVVMVFIYPPVCFWHIFKKVGWPKWIGLLSFIPAVNLILLGVLAFKRWPNELDS